MATFKVHICFDPEIPLPGTYVYASCVCSNLYANTLCAEKQVSYINAYIWNLEKMVQMSLFEGQE